MEEQSDRIIIQDRITTRMWELDLSLAGKVYSPKKRPTKHKRQKIVQFVGREGRIERFAIRQTLPHPDVAHEPPSQAQYGAVTDFFVECAETRHQANTMLSARDYAGAVVHNAPFTAPRRRFLWVCTTAFILADKDLRAKVRAINSTRYRSHFSISTGIANDQPYKIVSKFASKVVDDMRAQGAQIFG